MTHAAPDWVKVASPATCLADFNMLTSREHPGIALACLSGVGGEQGKKYLESLTDAGLRKHLQQQDTVQHRLWNYAYTLDKQVSGFFRDSAYSEEACATLEDGIGDFFPDKNTAQKNGRSVLIAHISHMAAKFASLADTRKLNVSLMYEYSSHGDNGHALEFSVPDDGRLQGEINLKGPGRLFADRNTYGLETLEDVMSDDLSGEEAERLEKNAFRLPSRCFAVWQGIGGKRPVISAPPRLSSGQHRLSISFLPLGEQEAYRRKKGTIGQIRTAQLTVTD